MSQSARSRRRAATARMRHVGFRGEWEGPAAQQSARSQGGGQRSNAFRSWVFQDTVLSESMEIDHNSSANFDEVRTLITVVSVTCANQSPPHHFYVKAVENRDFPASFHLRVLLLHARCSLLRCTVSPREAPPPRRQPRSRTARPRAKTSAWTRPSPKCTSSLATSSTPPTSLFLR